MANEFIARKGLIVLGNGAKVTGSLLVSGNVDATGFSVTATSFTGSFSGDGSGLTGIASTLAISGSTGSDILNLKTEALTITGSNGVTTAVTDNTVTISIPSNFTTTGSNSFSGIQTITNTTNSTNYADGALVVHGGVGIGKDVNISGSLTVTGLLTAVSQSIQYVTSSQLNIADNRIVVNTTEALRFGGISVNDSGSASPTSGSLYWDSFTNHWLYENASGSSYNSAILIAGPKNTGSLGEEATLVLNRFPVASGDDHIDNRDSVSKLRMDSGTVHVENGLYVTGSITASGNAIINNVLYSFATNTDVDSGTEIVATIATGSYDAAFFDYVVKNGANYRAGTVMSVWQAGTSNVEYTDTSTNDLGNTSDVIFTVDLVGGNARLKATVTTNNWSVKTAVRAL